jgi:hypothetical protein
MNLFHLPRRTGLCSTLCALSLLAGCAGTPPTEAAAPEAPATVAPAQPTDTAATPGTADAPVVTATEPAHPGEIEFFDASSFDDDLSAALQPGPQKVDVVPIDKFSLNQVPPRLGKWLSKVKSSGGKVQARALVADNGHATRALFGVAVDVVVAVYDQIHDAKIYGPVKQYDVVLWYRRETGQVERASFNRREGAQS